MFNTFKLILSHIVNGRNLRAHNLPLHVFIRSSAGNSASSPGKIIPLVDPAMQTRVLPDGSRISKYNKVDEFMRFSYPDAKTLYETIRRGSRISENGAMLGQREKQRDGTEPYVWISYNEAIDRAENIAQAFRRIGLNPGQGTFIGIFSKNCPEWVITEHAAYTFSNVLVPLYETLGAETSAFIINHTEIELVVCDTQEKAKTLLHNIEKFPTLKHIVCIDSNLSSELRRLADKAEINLYTFHELHRLGVEVKRTSPHVPPKPEDLATICYTSGTTGIPKGVMLTHGNVIADATIAEYFKYSEYTSTDSMLSFLPMAHMFERVMQTTIMLKGGRIGFFRGDIQLLIDDIQALQPSIMPVVPRVLNRLYHD
uniref:long-chain-fatty-acid--CoA ligase n=1 Tax=Acrobeloides nanus TaxID=290746 RepID=A0A914D0T0_9BILA